MTKEYGKTVVDVDSLGDFMKVLDTHHDALQSMLRTMENDLLGVTPKLGGFPDAVDVENRYGSTTGDFHARLRRLQNAVEAAQKATGSILDHYGTTEARNDAGVRQIATTVRPVSTALGES